MGLGFPRSRLLAPFVSVACAIHCVAAPLIAATLPATAAVVESAWSEWLLWSLSAALFASVAWRNTHGRAMAAARTAGVVLLVLAAVGLWREVELLHAGALFAVALLQVGLMLTAARQLAPAACCATDARAVHLTNSSS
jgi:hypothetical protein